MDTPPTILGHTLSDNNTLDQPITITIANMTFHVNLPSMIEQAVKSYS